MNYHPDAHLLLTSVGLSRGSAPMRRAVASEENVVSDATRALLKAGVHDVRRGRQRCTMLRKLYNDQ